MTVHEYIIPHVLVFRQHNGDDPPQEAFYGLICKRRPEDDLYIGRNMSPM